VQLFRKEIIELGLHPDWEDLFVYSQKQAIASMWFYPSSWIPKVDPCLGK